MKTEDSILKIVEEARSSDSWLIENAFADEDAFRQRSFDEISFWFTKIKELFGIFLGIVEPNVMIKALTEKVISTIDNDLKLAERFNKEIKELQNSGKSVTYAVESNKIIEFLTGAKLLITEHMSKILLNQEISGYDFKYYPQKTPILGDPDSFYGTSKPTFLKAALAYTYKGLSNEPLEALPFPSKESSGICNSASVCSPPLPSDLDLNYYVKQNFSLLTHDGRIILFYSGYGYGGIFGWGDVPRTIFTPQDCSSWIERLAGAKILDTDTKNFAYRWQFDNKKELKYSVPTGWEGSEIGKDMLQRYHPCIEVKPGVIMVYRLLKSRKGHAGIMLGMMGGKIIALADSRDMPGIEGRGIQIIEIKEQKEKEEKQEQEEKHFMYFDMFQYKTTHALQIGENSFPCSIGNAGIYLEKKEGDKATPAGKFSLLRVFYREDRMSSEEQKALERATLFPLKENYGWCTDPKSSFYNQLVHLPFTGSHEKLWRRSQCYDLIVVVGYNEQAVSSLGSAIFLHVIPEEGYVPTAGCIAFKKKDLINIISRLTVDTTIEIDVSGQMRLHNYFDSTENHQLSKRTQEILTF